MQGCCSKFIGNGRHHQPPSPLHAPQGLSDTPLTEALRNLSVRGICILESLRVAVLRRPDVTVEMPEGETRWEM